MANASGHIRRSIISSGVAVLVLLTGMAGAAAPASATGTVLAPSGYAQTPPQNLANPGEKVLVGSAGLVAYDGSGRAYELHDITDLGFHDVVYLRERPAGGAWGPAQVVPVQTGSYVRDLTMAVNDAGDIAIAFRSGAIYALRRPHGGTWSPLTAWGSPGSSSANSGCPLDPAIDIGNDGTTVVSWTAYDSCNGNVTPWRVMAAAFVPGTGWQTTPQVWGVSTSNSNSSPAVTVADDGSAIVAFTAGTTNFGNELWTAEVAAGSWTAPTMRSTQATRTEPAAASSGNVAAVAWYSASSALRLVRWNGAWLGVETAASFGQPYNNYPPGVAVANGTVYVASTGLTSTWQLNVAERPLASPSSNTIVTSPTTQAVRPAIAANAAGDVALAYDEIFGGKWHPVSMLRPAGSAWPTSSDPIGATPSDNDTLDQVAMDSFGHTLVAAVPNIGGIGPSVDVEIYTRDPATAPTSVPPSVTPAATTTDGTLTCDPGEFGGTPPFAYTYSWLEDGTPIAGAVANTFTMTAADAGHAIECEVSATNDGGTAVADSQVVTPTAGDGDGVSAAIEDAAPNGGDGNGDGIPDSIQAEVSSLPNAVDGAYLTLAAPAGTTLVNVTSSPVPGTPTPPADSQFPIGLLSFEVHGVTPGGSTDVALYLPAVGAPDEFYKLQNGAYVDATSAASVSGNVVTLTLVDGGPYDADGVANGTIVDPLLPGYPNILLVSTADDGTKADQGVGALFSSSSDGKVVAFVSASSNLPSHSSSFQNIYAKDLVTGSIALVSSSSAGVPANGQSDSQVISRNGRYVAFESHATNLDPADTTPDADLYVKDLRTGLLRLASTNSAGVKGNQTSIGLPAVSDDGDRIAYPTNASNFDPRHTLRQCRDSRTGQLNNCTEFEFYLKDMATGTVMLLSKGTDTQGPVTGTISVGISANGEKVLLASSESYVPEDTDGRGADVYVYDVPTATYTLVSTIRPPGVADSDPAAGYFPYMSDDGTRVVFQGGSSTWSPGDGSVQVYLKDLTTGALTLLSSNGVTANGLSQDVEISGDGSFASFSSFATNLDPRDTEASGDIYLKNLVTGELTLISTADDGTNSDGNSFISAPVDGGTSVIFAGSATNLSPLDAVADDDLYVKVTPAWAPLADADGVSTAVEDAAPNGGDGNADGIPDSQQNEVTSLPNAVDGGYVTLAAPAGTSIVNASTSPVPADPPVPAGADLSQGLIGFEVHGVAVGGSAAVELYLPAGVTPTTIYKLQHGAYVDATSAASISGSVVTLTLVDGGPFDADGIANGVIVDPVAVDVTVHNVPPIATGDSFDANEDTALHVAAPGVLGNDSDADHDALTAAIGTGAAHGVVSVNADGSFTYTPDANYFGPDSFTYTASDATTTSASATVTLTVAAVNDAPSFSKGADQSSAEDGPARTVTGWASNITTGPANEAAQRPSFAVTNTNPALFSVQPTIDAAGTLRYATSPDAFGAATVTVVLHDDGGTANGGIDVSAPRTFTLTVTPVADAPKASPLTASTSEDTAKVLTLSGSDADGDTTSFTIVGGPAHGTLKPLGAVVCTGTRPKVCTRTMTYTPSANANGNDSFTYRVSDGRLSSTAATVALTVTPVNDAPTISPLSNLSAKKSTTVSVPFVIADVDNAVSTLRLSATSSNTALVPNTGISLITLTGGSRVVKVTPVKGKTGTTTITISVTDGSLTTTRTFTITFT